MLSIGMILCRTLRSLLRGFHVGTLDILRLLHVYKYLNAAVRACMPVMLLKP